MYIVSSYNTNRPFVNLIVIAAVRKLVGHATKTLHFEMCVGDFV